MVSDVANLLAAVKTGLCQRLVLMKSPHMSFHVHFILGFEVTELTLDISCFVVESNMLC